MGQIRDRMNADLRLAGRAESTRKRYIQCARLFVKYFMRSPDQLDESHVREFMLYLTEKRQLAVGTRLAYLGALKFLYSVTLKRPEVTEFIPWPRAKDRLPIVATRQEVAQLLEAAQEWPYWRAFLLTSYAAGLRRFEVAALRAQDIDSRAGLIRVENGKGGKRRLVMLDERLLVGLRRHWRLQRLPGPWLFPSPTSGGWRDRPITPSAATAAFRRITQRAGLQRRITLHHLRSAFTTHLVEDGVNIATLQRLLGHKRIETTIRYTRVRTDLITATPSLLKKLGL